jgi:hypothetical protein
MSTPATLESRFQTARPRPSPQSGIEADQCEPDLPRDLELIIGHTSHESSKIWVRGSERFMRVHLSLRVADASGGADEKELQSPLLTLEDDSDFTAVWEFEGLSHSSLYTVTATFHSQSEIHERGARRIGHVRTFPLPSGSDDFVFLFGSCNLSTVLLGRLGRFGASYLGLKSAETTALETEPKWHIPPKPGTLRERTTSSKRIWLLIVSARWLVAMPRFRASASRSIALISKRIMQSLAYFTRFEAAATFLPSPFIALRRQLETSVADKFPAFMLHAGDQIYFDVELQQRAPSVAEYRSCYRETWQRDAHLRELFASLPHYMILDDHEVIDNLGTEGPACESPNYSAALQVYREYVDCHNPDRNHSGFDYSFQHGNVHYFVLDIRTEREPAEQRMISEEQLARLSNWLDIHSDALKFIVSSVPLFSEVLVHTEDKWCGSLFRRQRDAILGLLHKKQVQRLVVLVGDVHCCYHATLTIGRPKDRVTFHELAGGPLHQLSFSSRDMFSDCHRGSLIGEGTLQVPYRSVMHEFYSASCAAMRIAVEANGKEVHWQVVPTTGSSAGRDEVRNMQGRIAF